MSKAVLRAEWLSRVEGTRVYVESALSILWMHALEPAITQFLLERSSGKGKPRFIEPVAALIRTGAPDHDGRRGHTGEPLLALLKLHLALTQSFTCEPQIVNVCRGTDPLHDIAGAIPHRDDPR
jgi:hypothetical protein